MAALNLNIVDDRREKVQKAVHIIILNWSLGIEFLKWKNPPSLFLSLSLCFRLIHKNDLYDWASTFMCKYTRAELSMRKIPDLEYRDLTINCTYNLYFLKIFPLDTISVDKK